MKQATTYRTMLTSVVAFGVALALPAAAAAQAQTTPQYEPVRPIVSVTGDDQDESLEDRIEFELETSDALRKYDLDVDVDDTVATLSGELATEAQKTQALELAKVDGITRVEDAIEIDSDVDETIADRVSRGLSTAGETIDDGWITTKVHWFFVREDALDGSDIDVDTNSNVVTLKGTVASEAGRRRAVELARMTEGVTDVRDQLTVAAAQ